MRDLVLAASLAMIGLLAFLSISVAVEDGVTPLVVVSIVILAVLGFGVLGAIGRSSDE